MATKTTYSRFAGLVIEHKIEVPDAPAPAAEPKPARGRAKRERIEESPSSSDDA